MNSTFEIIIDNLPANANESAIQQHFDSCGMIKRIKICYPKNAKNANIRAYLSFTNHQSVNKALNLHNSNFLGNNLSIITKQNNYQQQQPITNQPQATYQSQATQQPQQPTFNNYINQQKQQPHFNNNLNPQEFNQMFQQFRIMTTDLIKETLNNTINENKSDEQDDKYELKLPSELNWKFIHSVQVEFKKYDYRHYKFVKKDIYYDFFDALSRNNYFRIYSNKSKEKMFFLILSQENVDEMENMLKKEFMPSIIRGIIDIKCDNLLQNELRNHSSDSSHNICVYTALLKRRFYSKEHTQHIISEIEEFVISNLRENIILHRYQGYDEEDYPFIKYYIYNKHELSHKYFDRKLNHEQQHNNLGYISDSEFEYVCDLN